MGITIANSSPPPKAANTKVPTSKGIQHYTKIHLSVSSLHSRATETSGKVSTAEAACPYLAGHTTTEQQWQDQNATQSTPTLPNSTLISWTYHHRTATAGPKLHTVKHTHPTSILITSILPSWQT